MPKKGAVTATESVVCCIACECMRSRTVHQEGNVRTRECAQCGYRYKTIEILTYIFDGVPHPQGHAQQMELFNCQHETVKNNGICERCKARVHGNGLGFDP